MKRDFTAEAEKVLGKAAKFAVKMGNPVMGTEHLLFGLAAAPGMASHVLRENGLDKDGIQFEIENYCGHGTTAVAGPLSGDMSPKLERLLVKCDEEAVKMESSRIGTEHMLMAILKDTSCVAYHVLMAAGGNIQKIYMDIATTAGADLALAKSDLIASRTKNRRSQSSTPVLDQYARDLNQYARDGILDPVLGRDTEISSVIEILSRRTKNNPCLIGEPGVGKTAIAEGLATRIVEGEVPDSIADKRVLTLDLSGMVAGSKYRGEFEERIKRALRETRAMGNILLFIDEIHTVIGAGGAEGAIDASNILKPALARGEVQVIGATTREEYRKHVEKDAALERRFQPVVIEEPSEAQTVTMLRGLRSRYEDYHQVIISDAAIDAAVRLSVRYVNDRFLPDKAIDLIDEASARLRLGRIVRKGNNQKKLEAKAEKLYDEREQALIDGDMELVLKIREQEKELEDTVTYDAYTGQAGNVYWARTIVGLCEQGKEPKLAEEYMNLLLSDPMMRKWWLDKPRNHSGLTIRKDSLGDILDIDNIEFGQTMGFKDPTGVNHPNFWPTEEEKQWLYQMMEDASCCYRPGTMLEECAMEVGVRVLDGELTPEEGAKEVERKMAIAMEE